MSQTPRGSLPAFLLWIFFCVLAAMPYSVFAQSGPHALNLSGGLFDSAGQPLLRTGVNFKLEVRDKTGSCVLYSELHSGEDLSTTKGQFSLLLGAGQTAQNFLAGGSQLDASVFLNRGVTGAFTGCPAGVTLASGDERVVRIYYDVGAGMTVMTPDVPVVSSAYAMIADSLQGKGAADFIQVKDDGSTVSLNQANTEYAFSFTNWPKLKSLIDGTSSAYLPMGGTAPFDFNNQRLIRVASPGTSPFDAVNKGYADANIGGRTADFTGVGPAVGDGKTMVWDQAAQKWVVGNPTITGTAGGDLSGTYPNPVIAASAVTTTKVADNAITSNKINTTGVAVNRLVATDATTGSTLTYFTCGVGEIMWWTATGWQCTTVAALAPVKTVAGKTPNASGDVPLNAADISGLGTVVTKDFGSTSGQVPLLDASNHIPAYMMPTGTGTITSVNVTSPILGGGVSGAVTISLDVGTAANQVVRLNASAQLPAVDGSLLTGVNATKIGTRAVASTAPSASQVLAYNATSSQWEPMSAATGSVTSVVSGTGLVAGTITSAGTINVDVGTTAGKIVQLDGSARYPANDGSQITNVNATKIGTRNVSTTAPTALQVLGYNATSSQWEPMTDGGGTMTSVTGGTGLVAGTITTSGTLNVDVGTAAGKIVQLNGSAAFPAIDAGNLYNVNASKIGTRAVSTAAPGGSQVLGYNASLSQWEPMSAAVGSVTSVVAGTGLVAGTITSSGTLNVDVGTGANKIVQLNGSAAFPSLDGSNLYGVNASKIGTRTVASSSPSSNQVLMWNGSQWEPANASSTLSWPLTATPGTTPASAPSYSFAGSTNTGLFSQSVDTLALTTKGTTALTIDVSGNVGLGTTAPASKLDVNGDIRTNGTVWLGTTGSKIVETGGSISLAPYYGSILTNWNANLQILNGGGSPNVMLNGVANQSSYIASGNVGIGTTSPMAALEIAATGTNSALILPRDNTANRPAANVANGMIRYNTNSNKFEAYENGAWTNMIAAGGGTTAFPLLASPGTTPSIAPSYSFTGSANTGLYSPSVNSVALATFGTARLTVTSLGFVGIGTASPAGVLDVQGGTVGGSASGTAINLVAQNAAGYDNVGGGINLTSGNGGTRGPGGTINIKVGDGGTEQGDGGPLNLVGGKTGASIGNHTGGAVNLTGGAGSTYDDVGGSVNVTGGASPVRGAGGAVTIAGGAGGAVENGAGGNVFITGGSARGSLGASNGGNVLLTPGTGSNGGSNGRVGIGTLTPMAALDIASTGTNSALIVPRDTAANRPVTNVANGMLRYNTNTNKFEAYENGAWTNMIAAGGGTTSFPLLANPGTTPVTAPSYSFNGNANTGLYSPAANKVAIAVNGTAALILDASGLNVNNRYLINGSNALVISSNNLSVGNTLAANGTGSENTVIGYQAGNGITSGSQNTAVGSQALANGGAATGNTAIGWKTLYLNGGDNNSALGYWALTNNGSGTKNNAVGRASLYTNTTGSRNQAVGFYAQFWNSVGSDNVAVGDQAMMNGTSSFNTAVGNNAGINVTSASNTLVGYNAGSNITSGSNNVVIGVNGTTASATASNQISIANLLFGDSSAARLGIGISAPQAGLDVATTGTLASAIIVPRDTTANRPTTAVNGMIRYNSSLAAFEGYSNGAWGNLASSGTASAQWTYGTSGQIYYNGGSVGIGTSTPTTALEVAGALRLSGSSQDSFITPQGSSVQTKIGIPLFTPASFAQVLALGLPAAAPNSSRGISLMDARSGVHQPTLSVFSPDENQLGGFSFDGTNTALYLKSSVGLGFKAGTSGYQQLAITETDGAVALGRFTVNRNETINASAGYAPGYTPVLDVQDAADTTLAVIRNYNTANTAVTRRAGLLFKLNNEVTPGQSANMAGVVFESTQPWAANPDLTFVTNEQRRMSIDASGRVAIGAGSPQAGLDVATTGTLASAIIIPRDTTANRPTTAVNGMIRYNSSTNAFEGYSNGAWGNLASSGTASAQWTYGTSGQIYYNGGYVGVGTNNPSAPLHVASSASALLNFEKTGGSANTSIIYNDGDFHIEGNNRKVWINGNTNAATVLNAGGGNVGINTSSPNDLLEIATNVDGQGLLLRSSGSNFATLRRSGVGGALNLIENGTTRVSLNGGLGQASYLNGGNFGLGTSSPQAGLDVVVTGTNSALVIPRDTQANRPAGNVANGMIRYNTSTNKFEAYENGAWTNMIAAGGGTTSFPLLASPGTTPASAPSYSFTGSTTTGLFSQAADTVALATAGTARLNVTAAGSVGIGVTAPGATLEVGGTGLRATGVANEGSTGGDRVDLGVLNGTPRVVLEDGAWSGTWQLVNNVGTLRVLSLSPGSDIAFYPASGNEAVRFATNGNVGIGTSTPKSLLELSATGTNSALILPRDTTANRPAGNVANGMLRYNTSTSKFEAYENGAWTNIIGGGSFPLLASPGTTTASAPSYSFAGDSNTGLFSPAADNIAFATGGATQMTIDSTGRGGFGTLPASNKRFYVSDTSTATSGNPTSFSAEMNANPSAASSARFTGSYIVVNAQGSQNFDRVYAVMADTTMDGSGTVNDMRGYTAIPYFNGGTVSSYGGFVVDAQASGTVTLFKGIDVKTPSANIGESRAINIEDQIGSTNQYAIYQSGSNDKSYFAGSVGIGLTAPVAKLDVNGGVRAGSETAVTTCNATNEGVQRYNYTKHAIEWCNGTTWISATSVAGTTPSPTGMGGTGYFVLSNSTWDGNLGGLAGANAKCRTELSTYDWKGKPGTLDTSKVFAFLCDGSACQNPIANTTYYYATANDTTAGGAFFVTDNSTNGPLDNYQWNALNRFNAAAKYFSARYYHDNQTWGEGPQTNGATIENCYNYTSNSSGAGGYTAGISSTTDSGRWRDQPFSCDQPLHLICYVNP